MAAKAAANRRCAVWDGWLDAAQRELRAAGGSLSWRRLQTALVTHYCSKVHPYCPCDDVWVGCCAIAKLPTTYLCSEDGFVRLPDGDLAGPKSDTIAPSIHAQKRSAKEARNGGQGSGGGGGEQRWSRVVASSSEATAVVAKMAASHSGNGEDGSEEPPSKRQRQEGEADEARVVQGTGVEGEAPAEAREFGDFKAHIGELPFSANEDSIKEFFAGCGNISKCDLLLTHEAKSRGIAFISFTGSAGLQAALKLNGHVFRGRPIKVNEAAGQGAREKGSKGKGKAKGAARRLEPLKGTGKGKDDEGKGKSKGSKDSESREFEVFVGGLPYTTSVECIHKDFSDCGEIGRFKVPMGEGGEHTGIAFVNYLTREGMEKALDFNEKEYGGVWIRVQRAVAPKSIGKGSGKIEMF